MPVFRNPVAAVALSLVAGLTLSHVCTAQGAINDWSGLKFPPPPILKPVTVDPKTTALLLFDFTTQSCSRQRRPRCAASMPKMKKLLDDAHKRGMYVIYSVALKNTAAKDIMPDITPKAGEPVLPSLGPDKFLNSNFEKMLRDNKITTIIINGTSAESTVLHTGGEAALRGFNVVAPVDGMSSNTAFVEAYTAYHLVNTARVKNKTELTSVDMISYK